MEGDVALSPSPTGTHTSLAQGILRLRNDFDSGMISEEERAAGVKCLLSHYVSQGIGHPTPREAARSGTTFLPTPRALFSGDPSKLAPPVVEGSIQPGTSVTASKVMQSLLSWACGLVRIGSVCPDQSPPACDLEGNGSVCPDHFPSTHL